MPKRSSVVVGALLALVLPLASSAQEGRPPSSQAPHDMGKIAQNEMKPMGASEAAPHGPTQMQMPMPMPMGQDPQQQSMPGCLMMPMMQNMMKMGSPQQGPPSGAAGGSTAGVQPSGNSAARIEGQIAFLRTELHITDAQTPAWDAFAAALRSGRGHLDAARTALQESNTAADPVARLEGFENHLKSRTEALHMTRMAFSALYVQLDESQKRTAIAAVLPFLGAF